MNNISNLKIVIIRLSSMGDVFLCTPLAKALKMAYPHSRVEWIVYKPFHETLANNPYIDQIHSLNRWRIPLLNYFELIRKGLQLKRVKYDILLTPHCHEHSYFLSWLLNAKRKIVFDFPFNWFGKYFRYKGIVPEPEFLPALERNEYILKFMGIKCDQRSPEIFLDPGFKESKENIYPAAGYPKKLLIGIHPITSCDLKDINQSLLRNIIDELGNHIDCQFVVFGGRQDLSRLNQKLISPKVYFAHYESFQAQAAILKQCDLLIGADSVFAHLAHALDIPVLVYYRISDPAIFGYEKDSVILESANAATMIVQAALEKLKKIQIDKRTAVSV